ncbi:MAG: BBP7 family outer membrane beta-barrel protein [Planctomycetota bacterium]
MKLRSLRSLAATLSVGICSVASAQYGYQPSAGQLLDPDVPVTKQPVRNSGPVATSNAYGSVPQVAVAAPYQQPAAKPDYTAPAKWNRFQPASTRHPSFYQASTGQIEAIPTPEPVMATNAIPSADPLALGVDQSSHMQAYPTPVQSHATMAAPITDSSCSTCNSGTGYSASGGAWHDATPTAVSCAPAVAARQPLFPWFGSFDLVFFNTEDNGDNALVADGGTVGLWSSATDADSAVGYNVGFGRYLGCGQYGLGVNYFNYASDLTRVNFAGTAGNLRGTNQGYHDYHIDYGGGADQVYNHITGGSGDSDGAFAVRAYRDLDFQGVEVNLFSFGVMGARRAAALGCNTGIAHNMLSALKGFRAHSAFGYGGAGGPLVRPCHGKVQITTSHGFRWFEVLDRGQLEFDIYDNTGTSTYLDTLSDFARAENNLYGYQFGSVLNYCLASRLNLTLGGKVGIYGNDVEVQRTVSSGNNGLAYRFGNVADVASTTLSDTVLSTLCELDMGLGYRVNDALTVRGGYRVMAISGIATTYDTMSRDMGTSSFPGRLYADDSLFLHGAYVGCDYNF